MADTDNNFSEYHRTATGSASQSVTMRSTYEGGTHVPHMRPDSASYIDFLLGGASNAQFDLAANATLSGGIFEFDKYNPDNAALHVEISDTAGTIDVDVLLYPSLDGVTRMPETEVTKTSLTVIENKTADGVYSVKLNDAAISNFPFFFTEVVETANAGGSCDIRLFVTGKGAA